MLQNEQSVKTAMQGLIAKLKEADASFVALESDVLGVARYILKIKKQVIKNHGCERVINNSTPYVHMIMMTYQELLLAA